MSADLYCLQEVEPDAFRDMGVALGEGYGALYEQKHGRPEGSAIFWRHTTFQLSHHESIHFRAVEPGYDHLALMAFLTTTSSDHTLVAVSTHLRWGKPGTTPEQHLGLAQIREILARREQLLAKWPCWLVCGDLNATSDGLPIEAALSAGLELSCRSQRPWDTVNIDGRRRKLDYLLRSPEHLVPSPRPLPALQRDTPMPSDLYPSDHLPLAVDYRFSR